MQINHEILEFNPYTASVIVRYFTDSVPEGLVFNIDLPVTEGQPLTEELVEQTLEFYSPTSQIERLAAVKTMQVPDFLAALAPAVQPVVEPDTVPPVIEGADPLPSA